jgi:hypothetical protein
LQKAASNFLTAEESQSDRAHFRWAPRPLFVAIPLAVMTMANHHFAYFSFTLTLKRKL